jgi:PilZ domain
MSSTSQRPNQTRHAPTGRLWAPDGFSVPVSITQRADDVLLVIMAGAAEFTEGPLSYLTLESTAGRGIVRTPGAAELLEPNLLRFVFDETPELVQRREFVRVTVAKRVVLESVEDEGEVLADGLTVDISGGGMLVQLPRAAELPANTDVYFTLYLGLTEYDDQVSGTAKVIRKLAGNRAAIDFSGIDQREQERLIRYVFERQRIALAVTRGDLI